MTENRQLGISVERAGGEAYDVAIRGHRVRVDQPAEAGGADTGPTPIELLVAALAGCVAYYAGRYLARHGIAADGLAVTADFDLATERPARVGAIRLRMTLPVAFPAARREALLAVVSHCTVHNTLVRAPDISIAVDQLPTGTPPSDAVPNRTLIGGPIVSVSSNAPSAEPRPAPMHARTGPEAAMR